MAHTTGNSAYVTLIGPGSTYKTRVVKGAITSERIDDTYQIDRLEVMSDNLACEPELNWVADINGQQWVLEKAIYYGCHGAFTLATPRLSCSECCDIYTTEDGHGCTSLSEPVLLMPMVNSFWHQDKSREITVNGITMFEEQFIVHLQCDGRAALLGVNSMLRRGGCLFEVTAVQDIGVPMKLPKVTVQKLQAYNSLGDE